MVTIKVNFIPQIRESRSEWPKYIRCLCTKFEFFLTCGYDKHEQGGVVWKASCTSTQLWNTEANQWCGHVQRGHKNEKQNFQNKKIITLLLQEFLPSIYLHTSNVCMHSLTCTLWNTIWYPFCTTFLWKKSNKKNKENTCTGDLLYTTICGYVMIQMRILSTVRGYIMMQMCAML